MRNRINFSFEEIMKLHKLSHVSFQIFNIFLKFISQAIQLRSVSIHSKLHLLFSFIFQPLYVINRILVFVFITIKSNHESLIVSEVIKFLLDKSYVLSQLASFLKDRCHQFSYICIKFQHVVSWLQSSLTFISLRQLLEIFFIQTPYLHYYFQQCAQFSKLNGTWIFISPTRNSTSLTRIKSLLIEILKFIFNRLSSLSHWISSYTWNIFIYIRSKLDLRAMIYHNNWRLILSLSLDFGNQGIQFFISSIYWLLWYFFRIIIHLTLLSCLWFS